MIGLGLVSFLVGLFLLFSPAYAAGIFAVFAGIAIVVLAAIVVVEGLFIDREGVSRWGVFILGILGLLLGIIVIAAPSLLVIATGVALGLFLFCFGIVEAVVAYMILEDLMVRLVIAMMGLFAILLGTVIMLNPTAGIDTLVLLTGLYLVVIGMMRVAHGLTERHAEQTMTTRHL
ncbi:MAG: DUF308 domain-containing protein [Methanoregula sp.]|nr:DUF308 domain-containing protein [Methanoregula sp.]